jgi:type II secretory pathway component PulF
MNEGLPWRLRKKLYQHASSQIENGLTPTETLEHFRANLERRGRRKHAANVNQIYRRVRDGATLMEAMGEKLTDMERSVLASGEKAGELPSAMILILEVREMISRMQTKLFASFFAPVAYMISFYAVLVIIGTMIVPPLALVLPAERWEGWGYFLYFMGQLAVGWSAPIIVLVFCALALAAFYSLPSWRGAGRAFMDRHVFPFTLYREVVGFTWLLSYATLIRAGASEVNALTNQMSTASRWQVSRLQPIRAGVVNGLDLAASMRRSGYEFPSKDLIEEVGAYVPFPNFPEKIDKATRDYAKTLEKRITFIGLVLSAVFTLLMFFAFFALQMGANSISSAITSSVGAM